jgi:hypothetical protein
VRRVARRAGRAVRRYARRGATLAGRVAADQKHTIFAVGTSALLGAIEDRVPFDKIPGVKYVTPAGLIGLGLFGLSYFVKTGTAGQIIRHGATGCLSVASYVLSKKYLGKGTVSGLDDPDFEPYPGGYY